MTTNTTNAADDLPPALPSADMVGAPVKAAAKPRPSRAKAATVATQEPKTEAVVGEPVKEALPDRVRIVIDEPNNAPSNQQFFGMNGKGFLITFGEPVWVPRAFLAYLNDLVQTKSVPKEGGGTVDRDGLRFPYRVVG